ncbi:MAG: hypothetical protein WED05_10755 [Candidatus Atabeyarchaeum deiterrae]
MVNLETKDYLLALIFIVFGILIIVVPYLLTWLIGLAFIILGLGELIPRASKK